MNKIVKEHYPASKLPVDLREGLDPAGHVTVIIQAEGAERVPLSRSELAQLIKRAQKAAKGVTTEEAVGRIRVLRDEWDD